MKITNDELSSFKTSELVVAARQARRAVYNNAHQGVTGDEVAWQAALERASLSNRLASRARARFRRGNLKIRLG
jgi:hypothetical protein